MTAARRLAEALSKGLLGVVLDSRIDDVREFEREIADLGFDSVIERWNRGNIVVFHVNTKKLRGACLYERCSSLQKVEVEPCIYECMREKLDNLRRALDSTGGYVGERE